MATTFDGHRSTQSVAQEAHKSIFPGRDQRDAIWAIYTRHYGLNMKQARPDDTD